MYISLFFLIFLFLIFITFERLKFRWNFFSPIVLLGGPLIFMVLLANLTYNLTGFIPVVPKAINILSLGLSCFWMGGMYMTFIFKPRPEKNINLSYTGKFPYRFFNISCVIFILILFSELFSTLQKQSIFNIESNDVEDFAKNGLESHIGSILRIYLIFYIVSLWEKKCINRYIALLFCVLIFFIKMASGVRGDVLLPFLGALIYLVVKGYMKITIKNILIGFLFITTLFIVPTLFFKEDSTSDYLFYYFIFYCFAGVLGFSSYMDRVSIPWETNLEFIHTFFINLYIKILGEGNNYLSLIQSEFMIVTTAHSPYTFTSNVYTLIGELYITSGYIIASIYLFFLGMYSYLLFLMCDRGIIMLLLYCFVGASLVLGIFSQYVLTPGFYEIPLFLIILFFISKTNIDRVFTHSFSESSSR